MSAGTGGLDCKAEAGIGAAAAGIHQLHTADPGVRMQLWRNLRGSLASSQQALLSGGSPASQIGLNELEAIDALKLNMEMYLDTYAHMLRVWTMVCLTPFQVGFPH